MGDETSHSHKYTRPAVYFFGTPSDAITGLIIGLAALFLCLIPLLRYGIARKNWAELKDFQKNIRFTFAYDGFDINNEKSSSQLTWDELEKVVETKDAFHFFFNKAMFQRVPKRCFTHPEDIKLLREILRSNLAEKGKLMENG